MPPWRNLCRVGVELVSLLSTAVAFGSAMGLCWIGGRLAPFAHSDARDQQR